MTAVVSYAAPPQRAEATPASPAEFGNFALVVLVGTTSEDEHTIALELRRAGLAVQAGELVQAWPAGRTPLLVNRVAQVLHRRLSASLHVTALAVGSQEASPAAAAEFDEPPLIFAELRIDPVRREVWVASEEVQLSRSEFGLLYLMATREGRVFTREELVSNSRRSQYTLTERSIDVHVAALRRKLRQAARHLQTVRGVGYRFVAEPRINARP